MNIGDIMEAPRLTCVGHLLAKKDIGEHKSLLKHLCTVIFCNVEDNVLNKESGFVQFDKFFSNLKVTVETFSSYLYSIQKARRILGCELERLVEKIVWDLIKFDFNHYTLDRKLVLFRIYCLFNRFCEIDGDSQCLEMSNKSLQFLAKEIGMPFDEDLEGQRFTLESWFQILSKSNVSAQKIKRAYDQFVRDVVKEGRLKFRVLQGKGASNKRQIKTITITSRQLLIFEDVDGEFDQPHVHEPTGRVLFHLDLDSVNTHVTKSRFEKNKVFLQMRGKEKDVNMVEMVFDSFTGMFDLYAWRRALEEAHFLASQETTRLGRQLGLLNENSSKSPDLELLCHTSPFSTREPTRRSSDPSNDSIKAIQKECGASSASCTSLSSCSFSSKDDSSSLLSFRSREDPDIDRWQSLEPSPSSLRRRALKKISASTTNLSALNLRRVLGKSRSGSFDVLSQSNSGRTSPRSAVDAASPPKSPESIQGTKTNVSTLSYNIYDLNGYTIRGEPRSRRLSSSTFSCSSLDEEPDCIKSKRAQQPALQDISPTGQRKL